MPFTGTDIKAYKKAGKEKTKQAKSIRYYKEKNKNITKNASRDYYKKYVPLNDYHGLISQNKKAQYKLPFAKSVNKDKFFYNKKLFIYDTREKINIKIISTLSDDCAKILVESKPIPYLSDKQNNTLRSYIAFIISKSLNRIFEKSLENYKKSKTYIKIGKFIYKIIIKIKQNVDKSLSISRKVKKVKITNSQYINFLENNPAIDGLQRNINIINYLDKEVKVVVDKPIGSIYEENPKILYPVNFGFITSPNDLCLNRQYAYVLEIKKPLSEYTGMIKAVIIRVDKSENIFVIAPKDTVLLKDDIIEKTMFQEQNHITKIIM